MVKNYWRQICFDTDSGAGDSSSAVSQNKADFSADEAVGDGKSDITFSIEDSQGLEAIDDSLLQGHDPEADAAAEAEANTSEEEKTKALEDKKIADDAATAAEAKAKEAESQSEEEKAKAAEEKKTADSSAEAAEAKKLEDEKSQTPPKGYVPLKAVQEVRGENKYLKDRIKELEANPPKPAPVDEPAKKESALPKDFKVLSDNDYANLVDDDPKDALMYMKNLGIHQEEKRQAAADEQQKSWDARELAANQKETQKIFDATSEKMEELVPGIFDKESPAAKELSDFALELGFTDDMYYLTNPETRIILPGETEPLLLGEQAASIVQTLTTARTKLNESKEKAVDEVKLREDIKKEVEIELRESIGAEFLAKFKKSSSEEEFRSLDSVPSTETAEFGDKVLSMNELNKLSEKEQEAYLAGA